MKKFLSGVLCGLLIAGLVLSAAAISGRMTIEVDPVNIQVNGEMFRPRDVNGKDVPVFAYNGTTYAPLRALAEAYGLQVGYDAEQNMATVVDPTVTPAAPTKETPDAAWSAEDEAAYQEFKGMWSKKDAGESGIDMEWKAGDIFDYAKTVEKSTAYRYIKRMLVEYVDENHLSGYVAMRLICADITSDERIIFIYYKDGKVFLARDLLWSDIGRDAMHLTNTEL